MSAHRSSRRVALLLAEINRTLQTIESNGQAGSVAHAQLLKQKQQLMGLNSAAKRENPKPEPAKAKVATGPREPTEDEVATMKTYGGVWDKENGRIDCSAWFAPASCKQWCAECCLFIFANLFPNSLEHDPADLPRAVASHNKNIHGVLGSAGREN